VNNIKIFRRIQNLTQQELAKKMKYTRPHLAMVELGRLPATKKFRARVSEALGVEEQILFPATEKDKNA
jgi:transcriptional regulator with XRE-family HTH domain